MDTTLNLKQTDPQHVLVTRTDEELAHAYEQITRADEQIARADEQLSKLEHEAAGHPSDHSQTRMNKLRAAVPGNRPSFGGRAVRGFTGLMLAAASASLPSFGSRPTAMRLSRLSRGGRPSSSRLHRCRSKTPGSPRNRAHLPFRRSRRRQQLHNQHLWLRPYGKTSCRPSPPCRPS